MDLHFEKTTMRTVLSHHNYGLMVTIIMVIAYLIVVNGQVGQVNQPNTQQTTPTLQQTTTPNTTNPPNSSPTTTK